MRSQYDKMVAVTDATATLEHCVRSYLSSNCGHCHRGPGNGEGPFFDARFETPILSQNIASNGGTGLREGLIQKFTRLPHLCMRCEYGDSDATIGAQCSRPNLADNVRRLVNYPYDIASVTAPSPTLVRVQFNRAVESLSAVDPGVTDNQQVTISHANINGIQNATASASLGFLVGDINNSRPVNASDIIGVKARSGQPTTAANYKFESMPRVPSVLPTFRR